MSKLRKYNMKNKRSFIIIVILAILIVCVFSLFIYKYTKASKIEYVIESGNIIQDITSNYLTIDDDAILKVRWDGTYYLEYNKEKTDLTSKVIAYNTITGQMKLYGNYYEIMSDGKIVENKKETILPNTTNCKFYKIDDRKYLLVDTKIYSDDYSIEANSYLLVELDKAGNAKLSNNKINLKTISPTKLVTSKYTFDIANEILKYGNYEIDLKKIIGSTNQYVPETSKDNDKTNNTPNNNPNNNQNNIANNIGTGSNNNGNNNGIINETDNGNTPTLDEIMNKVKMTSVMRVVEGITQIDIDYVIYDPYNQYSSVYVEVVSPSKIDVVYLSKNDTHLTLNNLTANTKYKLNFIYTTSVENKETNEIDLVPYTFEQFESTTLMPKYSISINRLSKVNNKLTYKVNLQDNYPITSVNVNLSFDYEEMDPETGEINIKQASIDGTTLVNNNISSVYGDIDISGYNINQNTLLKLTIKSVETPNGQLQINVTDTFGFGR